MDGKDGLAEGFGELLPEEAEFEVRVNDQEGRYMVASKDLEQDTWFLLESPVVCWPLSKQGGADGVDAGLSEVGSWCEGCLRELPELPEPERRLRPRLTSKPPRLCEPCAAGGWGQMLTEEELSSWRRWQQQRSPSSCVGLEAFGRCLARVALTAMKAKEAGLPGPEALGCALAPFERLQGPPQGSAVELHGTSPAEVAETLGCSEPFRSRLQSALGSDSARSAAGDATFAGRMGIKGLVEANNSAELLRLAYLQSRKMRKITSVAAMRSSEATGVVAYMQNVTDPGMDSGLFGGKLLSKIGGLAGEKDPLKWQIDTGEGFLKDAPDDMMGDMLGAGMAMAKGLMKKKKGKKGKGGGLAGLAKGLLSAGSPPKVDMAAYEMQKQLRITEDFARRAVLTAAQLEDSIGKASGLANETVGKSAELLNLPGFPPQALRRPPPPKGFGDRPSDMAPAFLDFLYQIPWKERVAAGPNSILAMADPYSEPGGVGREVHDFFGSPPLPPPPGGDDDGQAGLAGAASGALGAASGALGAAAGLATAL
ncbi:unnamed protein product [Effrenium voratum]|uniref:Uncharacterized protein n=1 Tax=Effrenium voratum TaxID=2562239 RepID=A0AA36I1P2_9DINO|nr:unnamed protein product [Effrenium voratum]